MWPVCKSDQSIYMKVCRAFEATTLRASDVEFGQMGVSCVFPSRGNSHDLVGLRGTWSLVNPVTI